MKVKWDEVGERFYETGCDRGVIYSYVDGAYTNGEGWNGLQNVKESPSGAEPTNVYANNHKYLELRSAEEFGFTIEAFMYPDAFAKCNGEAEVVKGVVATQQNRETFGLTYRNLIGNDVEGDAYGYKLHLVYGAKASPSEKENNTINEDRDVNPMSWECTTTAVDVPGFKPTSHFVIDSRKIDAAKLAELETILYGKDPTTAEANDGAEPRLPLPSELLTLLKAA